MNEEALFHLVLAQSPPSRAAFLAQACPDPALRRRVMALIAAHDTPLGVLDQPLFCGAAAAPELDQPLDETDGARIGPYRLIRKLGEGGMGVVYLAEQTQPVTREVALKLLRVGRDSRQVIARFEAERQVLAGMDHPNIARVFDAGTTAAGRPYFVLELIQGVPITTFCDQNALTLEARVELLLAVCRAIQHAHQRGIIHRDLKPSNVLVTRYDGVAVPKVIDFGVAKAIDRQLDHATLTTEHGAVIGTLQYMSPEQAGSDPRGVDTRSDVYSLGVLLYELWTGTTPIERARVRETPFVEVLRLVREEEPPRPSTRVAGGLAAAGRSRDATTTMRGALAGELDWIVLKALEKEPDQRYESVGALASDLRHWLDDEPVAACPPTTAYRLRKFARKHRTRLRVAAAFLLLLVVATIVSVWFAIDAKRESAQKELSRQEAAAATTHALDALAALTDGMLERLLARQVQLTASDREYLRGVLARYERFAAQKGDSEESRAIRAEGAFRVGTLHLRLEERDAALDAFEAARTGYRRLAEDFGGQPKYRLGAAKACTNIGLALREIGKWEESAAMERSSLAASEELAAAFPDEPEYRHSMADSHLNLASLWESQGLVDRALAELRAARSLFEELAVACPGVERQRELAMCVGNLANALRRRGDLTGAIAENRRALGIVTALVADAPGNAGYRQELARYHANLATALLENGEAADARGELAAALREQTRLAADFPTVPSYRVELARSHANCGVLLNGADPSEAESHFRSAQAIQERLVADFPDSPSHAQDLAASHNGFGNLLADAGKLAASEAELREAMRIRERLVTEHPQVLQYAVELAGTCCNLGNLLLACRQQPAESLPCYDKAVDALIAVLAVQPDLAAARAFLRNSYEGRYQALRLLERTDEALADVDRCLALCDGTTGALARLGRFEVLISVDVDRAMAELDRVAAEPATPDETLHHAVVVLCQIADQEDDKQARGNWCKRAVSLLEQLKQRGYLRVPANRARLSSEPAIAVLRDQDGFAEIMKCFDK